MYFSKRNITNIQEIYEFSLDFSKTTWGAIIFRHMHDWGDYLQAPVTLTPAKDGCSFILA